MTERHKNIDEGVPAGERLVFILPQDMEVRRRGDELDLSSAWDIVWNRRWQIIVITVFFAIASVSYALLAPEWYRAEVLLVPAEEKSTPTLGGQLGGLAALAGVSVGGDNSAEAVATLKSRDFSRAFIEDLGLVPVFFSDDWDSESNSWREKNPDSWPDTRDAVRYFHEEVLRVSEDSRTNLVTVSIDWIDPEIAAQWATAIVRRVNDKMRLRALREAEANVAYLQREMSQTNIVTLQQSISRLLESELQKLMLARGNEEFAFRIIDPAAIPKERIRPQRALVVLIGVMLGLMLAIFGVFFARIFRQ